jgi:DNA-directed RNA polymerase subunit RPC12/RpoP
MLNRAELQEFASEDAESIERTTSQIVDRMQALKIQRDYVCSVCWKNLQRKPLDRLEDYVFCPHHAEHRGFVSKHYVERRRSEDAGDSLEVTHSLRDWGIIENPHAWKTAEQLLSELGF